MHDYGAGFPIFDSVGVKVPPRVDWTITNPPFRLAEAFIERALKTSGHGVAVIVRSAFLEGVGRHDRLFKAFLPTDIIQFAERVVMHKGKLTATDSTATAYFWMVWRTLHVPDGIRFHWILSCRKRLERDGDYEEEGREVM